MAALHVPLLAAALVVPTEEGMVIPVNDDLLARADEAGLRHRQGLAAAQGKVLDDRYYALERHLMDNLTLHELVDELAAALRAAVAGSATPTPTEE